jgi:hypothetical protein
LAISLASVSEVMKYRLATAVGKQKYKLRQQTVEPIFGILNSVLGFRRFLLLGWEKSKLEWMLVGFVPRVVEKQLVERYITHLSS